MKLMKPFSWLTLLISLLTLSACSDLSKLNDEATLQSVKLLEHSPSSILLDAPVIDRENRIVRLPVRYGKYQFPMRLRMAMSTPHAEVQGINLENNLEFSSIESILKFFLISESGLAHEWTLRFDEQPLPEGNLVQNFELLGHTPREAVLSYRPEIEVTSGKIRLLVANAHYPLTITPEITLSADAQLEGFSAGNSLTFEERDSEHRFSVTSASGNRKEWVVSLIECVELPATATRQELNGVDFNDLKFEVVSGLEGVAVVNRLWDVREGTIQLQLKDSVRNAAVLPATLHLDNFTVATNSELLALPLDGRLSFTEEQPEQVLYLIDRVSGTMRTWRVKAEKFIDNEASIVAISGKKNGTLPLLLSIDGFTIYPNDRKVVLVTSALFTSSLKVDLTELRVNLTAKLVNTPTQLTFSTSDATQEIVVESESGEKVSWTVLTKSRNAYKSDRAEVVGLELIQYESNSNKIRLAAYPMIDQAKREIYLTVEEGAWDFPLKLRSRLTTSPYSVVSPLNEGERFDGNGLVTFTDARSAVAFDVLAENGDRVRWTLLLKTSGVLNSEANLAGITLFEEPTNVQIADEYFIDTQNRSIILQVASGLDQFPLVIKPEYQLSTGAFTDIPNRFPISFSSLGATNQILVTSEDGITSTVWTLRLIYTPQIDNSGFERWENDTKPVAGMNSWTSANNTFVTGTRRSNDATEGNYSVQMTTSKVDNIFAKEIASGSIFTGIFKFNIAQAATPKLMTWFGTPFTTRPNRLTVDLNYSRGAKVEQSSDGKFTVLPNRVDSASVIVELLRYTGDPSKPIEYHSDPREDVEVIGRGEYLFTNTNGWVTARVPVDYTNPSAQPTHISISAASSARGDFFIGANGSRLLLDNLKLIYNETPSGAHIVSKRRR